MIDLKDKIIADIGSGDGIISKVIATEFEVKHLDMYEPYVLENTQFKSSDDCTFTFNVNSFEKTKKKPEYDAIFVITTWHHI